MRLIAAEMEMRQTCKACGGEDKFDFHVPDGAWKGVVLAHLHNRVVCLNRFDDYARRRQVDYSACLRTRSTRLPSAMFTSTRCSPHVGPST